MGLFDRLKGDPRRRFAKQVLRFVLRAGVARAWIDEEKFAIGYERSLGDAPAWLFLNNSYQECQGESDAFIEHRISTLVDVVLNQPPLPETWDSVRDVLRPVLRGATFGMGAPSADAKKLLARPALPYLREHVVIDTPTAMAYVMEDSVAKWRVTADQVFAAAHENLHARANLGMEPDGDDDEGRRVLRFIDSGDAYFASMILLEGWLAGLAPRVGGRPIAFVPDNNTLIVTCDDPAGMAALLELVEGEYNEAARSISPVAYTVDGSAAVIPYPASATHPAHHHVHRSTIILAANEYGAQKHWTEKAHQREGIDVYVAEFTVGQRPDESLFSYTVWAAPVDTLLPQADYVAFADTDQEAFWVPWKVLTEFVGLIPVEDMNPTRFRVRQWPDPSIVEQLRARAETP
ncbi:hypothetical protein Rhe02_00570 [Rhizocola hellebori]|uniref:DUF1444 family protein n=1 Tax=Rhizocola hellebori TaxID=1392758 RepID=A0A8J3VCP4_9ACTN|nr:hypothetical protein [Rhizocola hellebori]GIH01990.1 hypothetical protein Rhe02_00570 [Rhizocola hellebori]